MGFEGGGVRDLIQNQTFQDFKFPEVGISDSTRLYNKSFLMVNVVQRSLKQSSLLKSQS